jgi:hypothetical protein
MVEQAVATALAATLERAVEGVLVRVLSSYGLIPPQPLQIPIVDDQGTVISSHQAPLQLQPSSHSQQSSGFPQPVQQSHGHALQHSQPQLAPQDFYQQQPSDAQQQQQLFGYAQASYPQSPHGLHQGVFPDLQSFCQELTQKALKNMKHDGAL